MTLKTRAARENPLVPHAVLRSLYTSMAEARLLERHLTTARSAGRSSGSIRGEEACRASAIACLRAGDLVSDPSLSAAADLMLGAGLRDTLRAYRERRPCPIASTFPGRLPHDEDGREQVRTALGAAHALKLGGAGAIVAAFSYANRAETAFWQNVLKQAGSRELPLLLLLLPERKNTKRMPVAGSLSGRAQSWGVPGIPVDALDAVALYRVLQEATARARAGDGPTLIECLHWRLAGRASSSTADPLLSMSLSLVARGAATPAWQRGVEARFERKLRALKA